VNIPYGLCPFFTYGLWGTADLWVYDLKSLCTNLVSRNFYGLSGTMGFERYGLGEVLLHRGEAGGVTPMSQKISRQSTLTKRNPCACAY
jgi:hypothetical protein